MKFETLSFVDVREVDGFPKIDAWKPERTDDYTKDCAKGRAYFSELYGLLLDSGNPTFLSRVLAAQVRGGKWEAVEIGFTQAMAEKLMLS